MSENTGSAVVESTPPQSVIKVRVSRICRFKKQPRKFFDPEALAKLGISLKKKQIQPIEVITSTDPNYDYEIVDGERRWRAASLVGLEYLNAIVVTVKDADDQYIDSFISNCCREDFSALEKAEGLAYMKKLGYTEEKMADESGIDIGWIRNYLNLLKLIPEVQVLLDPERPKAKQLPLMRALAMVEFPAELQREIAEEIMSKQEKQRLTSKQADIIIKSRAYTSQKANVIPKRNPTNDLKLVKGFITRTKDEAAMLTTMSDKTFIGMMASRTATDAKDMSREIEDIIEHLRNLKQKIANAQAAGDINLPCVFG